MLGRSLLLVVFILFGLISACRRANRFYAKASSKHEAKPELQHDAAVNEETNADLFEGYFATDQLAYSFDPGQFEEIHLFNLNAYSIKGTMQDIAGRLDFTPTEILCVDAQLNLLNLTDIEFAEKAKEYSEKRLLELKAALGKEDDVLPPATTYLGRRNGLQKQELDLTSQLATRQEEVKKQEELIETIRSALETAGSPYILADLEEEKHNLYNIEKIIVTIQEDLERNKEELGEVQATVAHLQELIAKHENYPGFKFDKQSWLWELSDIYLQLDAEELKDDSIKYYQRKILPYYSHLSCEKAAQTIIEGYSETDGF